VREHRPGAVEKHATSVRQIDSARLATEELDPELAFDFLDSLAEWRLLHAELFRRARDVALLGDREKVPPILEFDSHIENDIDFGRPIGSLAVCNDAIRCVIAAVNQG